MQYIFLVGGGMTFFLLKIILLLLLTNLLLMIYYHIIFLMDKEFINIIFNHILATKMMPSKPTSYGINFHELQPTLFVAEPVRHFKWVWQHFRHQTKAKT